MGQGQISDFWYGKNQSMELHLAQLDVPYVCPIFDLYLVFSHFSPSIRPHLIMGGGTKFRFLVWQKSKQGAFLSPIRWPLCSMTYIGPLFTNWDTIGKWRGNFQKEICYVSAMILHDFFDTSTGSAKIRGNIFYNNLILLYEAKHIMCTDCRYLVMSPKINFGCKSKIVVNNLVTIFVKK